MQHTTDNGALALARAVRRAYEQGQKDYFMEPLVRVDEQGNPFGCIKDGDSVVFCCRRGEREIGLTEMFTQPEALKLQNRRLRDLNFVILTLYNEKFSHLPVVYPPIRLEQSLAQVLSEAGLKQFHCAESEKYAHVTFFFNGGNNVPYPGEEDACIPSPKAIDYAQVPELSLSGVVDEMISKLGSPDFALVNFANGDIIGHTTSTEAKIKAAAHVSAQLERLVKKAREEDYVVVITADHGNLEVMTTPEGLPDVAHTRNLVPFIVIDPRREEPTQPLDGSLCDVAPTILHIMGIEQPAAMTGKCLTPGVSFGKKRKALLVILDGWGNGALDNTNPIYQANTPYWDHLVTTGKPSALHASDGYVGLGDGKPGNSEAGHMNLGAGRVVVQDDIRIELDIENGAFFDNEVLNNTMDETIRRGKDLHLLSYLTYKSSHGSIEYALAVLKMARQIPNVYLHIIFDGRSTLPGSAPQLLEELDEQLRLIGHGQVVSGVGRGLVLDREKRYEIIGRGYDAMVDGKGASYR